MILAGSSKPSPARRAHNGRMKPGPLYTYDEVTRARTTASFVSSCEARCVASSYPWLKAVHHAVLKCAVHTSISNVWLCSMGAHLKDISHQSLTHKKGLLPTRPEQDSEIRASHTYVPPHLIRLRHVKTTVPQFRCSLYSQTRTKTQWLKIIIIDILLYRKRKACRLCAENGSTVPVEIQCLYIIWRDSLLSTGT